MILNRARQAIELLFVLFAIPGLAGIAVMIAEAHPGPVRLMDLIPIGGVVHTRYLRIAALVIAGMGFLLILAFQIAAWICGTNRHRLAVVFGYLVRGVIITLAGLVAFEAAVAIYSLLLIEVTLLQYFNLAIFLAIGGGAAFAVSEVIRACWSAGTVPELEILAIPLNRASEPGLWARVEAVAALLGARVPDHILVGPSARFFAAVGPARLIPMGERIEGEILHLSGPLLQTVSTAQLTALIGHELAHFQGEDLAYSTRFKPIYLCLGRAIEAMSLDTGWHGLSTRPARAILGFGLSRFALAQRRISRERELRADALGAKASDPRALVGALGRIGIGQMVWPAVTRDAVALVERGETLTNLGEIFASHLGALRAVSDPGALLEKIAGQSQPHPMDAHPPTRARAAELGVPLERSLLDQDTGSPAAIDLLSCKESTESALSLAYQRVLIAQGLARTPSNRPTALQRKKDTVAKRAAARRRVLEGAGQAGSRAKGAEPSPPTS